MEQTKDKIVWKIKLNQYLKTTFNKKSILWRLFWFAIAAAIVIPASAGMHYYITHLTTQTLGSGFISIHITTNSAVAFSMGGSLGAGGIYALQISVSLVILGLICFTNKWYYTFLLSLAFFGGAFNIFDRVIGFTLACDGISYKNEVLDYFQFSFNWGIFNLPDVFVLTGVISACALYVVFSIIALVKASKQDKHVKA